MTPSKQVIKFNINISFAANGPMTWNSWLLASLDSSHQTLVTCRRQLNTTASPCRYYSNHPSPHNLHQHHHKNIPANSEVQAHDTRDRNLRHKSIPYFWLWFLVSLSCKSASGFVWYQILTSIGRTSLSSKLASDVHVTEIMTCTFFRQLIMELLSKRLPRHLFQHYCLCHVCVYFRPQKCSSQTHMERKPDARNRRRLWRVCHVPYVCGTSLLCSAPTTTYTEDGAPQQRTVYH